MATAHDHPAVTRDDRTFEQFIAARNAGDEVAMRDAWSNLVVENFDRVRIMVLSRSSGHLSRAAQDDAVQQACIKLLTNMISTFAGTTMGEWVNATRTLVHHVCSDVKRAEARHASRQEALHRTGEDGGETEDLTLRVYRALEQAEAERAADEDERDAFAEKTQFLEWALPQLTPKRREVIELDRQDVPIEEIQKRTGMSRDAVYATRSRGLKDLARLAQEYAT